ncbi:hypothetical protein C8R47DRAFT_1230828 [Mycena vitilis]|nr:hypothetical protein C8R47DRAFT_1230828 [Mycena vitilis]
MWGSRRDHTEYSQPSRSVYGSLPEGSQHQLAEIQRLRQENLILHTKYDLLQKNFDSLLASLPNASSPSPSLSQLSSSLPQIQILKQKNYPHATYWQKNSWTKQISNTRGRSSTTDRNAISKNSLEFLSTEGGTPPTKARISEARSCSSSFYFELKAENALPDTWGQAPMSTKTRFRAIVESEIPELRLCDGHWKADKLASVTYSSWCGSHRSKVKMESDSDNDHLHDTDDESDHNHQKRKRSPDKQQRKKTKHSRDKSTNAVDTTTAKGKEKTASSRRRVKNPLLGQTMPPPPAPTPAPTPAPAPVPAPPPTAPQVIHSDTSPLLSPLPASPAMIPLPFPTPTIPNTAAGSSLTSFILAPSSSTVPLESSQNSSSTAPSSSLPPSSILFEFPSSSSMVPSSTLASSVSPVMVISPPAPSAPLLVSPHPLPLPLSTAVTPPLLGSAPEPTVGAAVGPVPPAVTAKKRAWNPSATLTTAKGMCAYTWKGANPAGDKDSFEIYFAALSKDKKKEWNDKEKNIKAAKSQSHSPRLPLQSDA